MLPFQHNVFHEIRTPTETKHARIVNRIAADIETSEAFPAGETNPAD